MYEIIEHFIFNDFIGLETPLGSILCDVSIILIYIALVSFVIWMFRVASRIIKI